jgi:hypothetical protein
MTIMYRTAFLAHKSLNVKVFKSAILLGAAVAGIAQAQTQTTISPALDRMSISGGAFYAEPKIHLGANTEQFGRVDTPDEKIDDETLPRVKADILLGANHGLSIDYFRYNEKYSGDFSGNTVYEGRALSGTASGNAKLRIELARLTYKYWFGGQNDVFGVGLGAAYLRAKISASANATVSATNPIESRSWSDSGSASDSAYAPVIDLGYRHSFNDQWRMYVEASGVKKNGGSTEGHVYNGAIGVEWFPHQNVGLVLDYGIQKIALQRNDQRRAELDLKLTGPSAYLKVRF